MLDVFSEEDERLIKEGISNLYWYRDDLRKAWLRAGVEEELASELFNGFDQTGRPLSKRQMMDGLYLRLRSANFNERVGVSRRFVRMLVEHRQFTPQSPEHRIDRAHNAALRLKERIAEQKRERKEVREKVTRSTEAQRRRAAEEALRKRFDAAFKLSPQERGYELERIFPELMRLGGIEVEEPFRIVGEQIDGAIRHDGHFYLIELKWTERHVSQADIASLYMKVEGKMDARGFYVAMNGYSQEVVQSLPKGKSLRVLMLDGKHVANAIYGAYTVKELLNYSIKSASLLGEVYAKHNVIAP